MRRAARYPKDLTGIRFGRLLVTGRSDVTSRGVASDGRVYWSSLCDCGNKAVSPRYSLVSGKATSCGCYARELARARAVGENPPRKRKTTDSLSERSVYRTMIFRCYNDKAHNFGRYGGRGIDVDAKWLESFDAFISDMGKRPTKSHSIERIDNSKGYSKQNCVWALNYEQSANKRNNKLSIQDAREIRRRRSEGESLKSIAKDFNIHVSMVSAVATGKCWPDYSEFRPADLHRD